jgi:hypothetical protein
MRKLTVAQIRPAILEYEGPTVAVDRNIICRVSGYINDAEGAYLVPENELVWFINNGINRYKVLLAFSYSLKRVTIPEVDPRKFDNRRCCR